MNCPLFAPFASTHGDVEASTRLLERGGALSAGPITSRALRRHRHTAPGFGNSTEDSGGTGEPGGISTGRRVTPSFQSEARPSKVRIYYLAVIYLFILFYFDLSLYITLLTGQRHAASPSAR